MSRYPEFLPFKRKRRRLEDVDTGMGNKKTAIVSSPLSPSAVILDPKRTYSYSSLPLSTAKLFPRACPILTKTLSHKITKTTTDLFSFPGHGQQVSAASQASAVSPSASTPPRTSTTTAPAAASGSPSSTAPAGWTCSLKRRLDLYNPEKHGLRRGAVMRVELGRV